MKPINSHCFVKRAGLLGCLTLAAGAVCAENWPSWRGPRGDGTSLETEPPTRWSSTDNVVWKTAVPGEGHSSPIVWNNRIFLTTALKDAQDRVLLSFDRKTGAVLWQQAVVRSPLEAKNNENSYASATPATDGEKVYVTFLDRDEVVVGAYDFSGKQLWLARPGRFKSQWGFSHTPLLFEDKVIVVCYSKGENFVVAVSRADGQTLWKTACETPTQSYSPPLIREMAGRFQMVTPGNKAVTSYDPRTGKVLWVVDGLADDSVITPVYHAKADLVLSCTSWPSKVLVAVKPDGEGNVTSNKVVWKTSEGAPYVPSPIAVGDWFFTASYAGKAAHCYEAATGKILWKEPMGLHHASPVTANGLVYFLNDDGVMHVVRAGPKFDLVARNELGEKTYASPALSGGQMFLRSFKNLYCLGQPAK
ncbi:MAG: PQQ-like beta-propeller repeat protein [Verrucomicrobia bacterium]|nr:PQQ-like beta-propeller repeat protein [Verrucomicrobiota bacterium]